MERQTETAAAAEDLSLLRAGFFRCWVRGSAVFAFLVVPLVTVLRRVFGTQSRVAAIGLLLTLAYVIVNLFVVLAMRCYFPAETTSDDERPTEGRSQELRDVSTSGTTTGISRGSRRSHRRMINEFLSSATQATIDRLPMYIFKARTDKENTENDVESGEGGGLKIECSICLEEVEAGEKMRVLPCMHQFHADCVDQWLLDHAKCPTCKFSIL